MRVQMFIYMTFMLCVWSMFTWLIEWFTTVMSLQKDGKHISWSHLVKIYERNQTASGLVFNKTLRREHVYLNSYSRMRVNLAAQVWLDITCLIYFTGLIIIIGSQFFYGQCSGLLWRSGYYRDSDICEKLWQVLWLSQCPVHTRKYSQKETWSASIQGSIWL